MTAQARLDELRANMHAFASMAADKLLEGDVETARRYARQYAELRNRQAKMITDALTLVSTELDLLDGE